MHRNTSYYLHAGCYFPLCPQPILSILLFHLQFTKKYLIKNVQICSDVQHQSRTPALSLTLKSDWLFQDETQEHILKIHCHL